MRTKNVIVFLLFALACRPFPEASTEAPPAPLHVVILGASTSADGVVGGASGGTFNSPDAWPNRLAAEYGYEVTRLGHDPANGRVASSSSLLDWLPGGCLWGMAEAWTVTQADVILWTPWNNTSMGSVRCQWGQPVPGSPFGVSMLGAIDPADFRALLELHVARFREWTDAPIIFLTDPEVPASCPNYQPGQGGVATDPCASHTPVRVLYAEAQEMCALDASLRCPDLQPVDTVLRPDHFDVDMIHPTAAGHGAMLAAAAAALEAAQ